jgi:hypothetical protein
MSKKTITIKPQKDKQKADIPKPFEVGMYKFFPCTFTEISREFEFQIYS